MGEAKQTGTQFKVNDLEIKKGNAKISNDTLIFNLTSAHECPSDARGLCRVRDKCYAKRDERVYPNALEYRRRQSSYWSMKFMVDICKDFDELFRRHRKALRNVKYLRFNESGDFETQYEVDLTDSFATWLLHKYGVQCYAHSARGDLDFSACRTLLVKSSGHKNGNNGMSILARGWSKAKVKKLRGTYIRPDIFVCPMTQCKDCDVCKTKNNINIIWTR